MMVVGIRWMEQVPMIARASRHERIAMDPAVMLGKLVIRGTRITVEQILRELDSGMTADEVIAAHLRLTADDIKVAQAFAVARLAAAEAEAALARGDFEDIADDDLAPWLARLGETGRR